MQAKRAVVNRVLEENVSVGEKLSFLTRAGLYNRLNQVGGAGAGAGGGEGVGAGAGAGGGADTGAGASAAARAAARADSVLMFALELAL